jgi:hypothetical protein
VDLRQTLQAPFGGDGFELREQEKTYIQSSRPWECGNPEGISKECGKPASWLSMLSILCHFHGLLFARKTTRIWRPTLVSRSVGTPSLRSMTLTDILQPSAKCRIRPKMVIGAHRLLLCALAITYSLNALGAANMMKGKKSVLRFRQRASESSDHVPGSPFEI